MSYSSTNRAHSNRAILPSNHIWMGKNITVMIRKYYLTGQNPWFMKWCPMGPTIQVSCELYLTLKKKTEIPPETSDIQWWAEESKPLLGDQYTLLPRALELERLLVTFISGFLGLDLCRDTCTSQITGGFQYVPRWSEGKSSHHPSTWKRSC